MKYQKIVSKLFEKAKKNSKVGRCRVIAAVVRRNTIYAEGCNSYSGGALAYRFKKHEQAVYNHAEIAAIKNFLKTYPQRDLSQYEMIVVRVKQVGEKWLLGDSKPCLGCQKAIKHFQIQQTIYMWRKKWVIQ